MIFVDIARACIDETTVGWILVMHKSRIVVARIGLVKIVCVLVTKGRPQGGVLASTTLLTSKRRAVQTTTVEAGFLLSRLF